MTRQAGTVSLVYMKKYPFAHSFVLLYSIFASFSLGCYQLLRILPDSYQVLGDRDFN